MSIQVIPILFTVTAVLLSIPVGLYLAWIMDGRYRPPAWLAWLEKRFDLGVAESAEHAPKRSWKSYVFALLLFNTVMFVFGYLDLVAAATVLPLNPDERKEMLAPSTIFNTASSFLTNTNLQHYAGEVHLSYFSQVVFVVWNMFVSAAVGICALTAIVRALRGDKDVGNFYLDMWRAVMYVLLPPSLLTGVLLMAGGVPMTFAAAAPATTVEKESMGLDEKGVENQQKVARGPVAAILPIKHLGTNGGGFFGANSAHPFENPNSWTNYLECISIMLIPLLDAW